MRSTDLRALVVCLVAIGLLAASCADNSEELAELRAQVEELQQQEEQGTTVASSTVAPMATTTASATKPVPSMTTQAPATTRATTTTKAPATTTASVPVGPLGSRSNPIPLGATTDAGEGWSLTITGVNLNAAPEIAQIDINSMTMESGMYYPLVELEMRYDGQDEPSSPLRASISTSFSAVGDGTHVVYGACWLSLENRFLVTTSVFAGGVVSGQLCIDAVDPSDIDSLLLFTKSDSATSGVGTDNIFFATQLAPATTTTTVPPAPTTTTVPPAMLTPQGLTASPVVVLPSAAVELSWNEPLDSSCDSLYSCPEYRIEQSINGVDWQLVDDGLAYSTYKLLRSLRWGNTYTYRVAQIDNKGVGPWAQTSIMLSTTPDGPDWVAACRIGASDNYQISWGSNDGTPLGDGGSPITGYLLEWGYGSTANQVTVGSSPYVMTSPRSTGVFVYSINANGQSNDRVFVSISSYSTQSMC